MTLRLVFGSSVSKKTEALYDALIMDSVRHPEQNYIIVVPEQASLQVQEAIVARHPRHAISNIDVLTFNRLAFRVFEETGERTREAMDDYGKIMLLRLVTEQHIHELGTLKKGIRKIGMLSELKSVISELVQYNVPPSVLREKAEALSAHKALQEKLRDLALIYEAFMTAVHEKREIAEERIARLAETLYRWPSAGKTTIAFEGFTGFTAPQYDVLRALLKCCPEVLVCVTAGSTEIEAACRENAGADAAAGAPGRGWLKENEDESALFHMSRTMTVRLRELAISERVEVTEAAITDTKLFTPEIFHLEKHIYRGGKAPYAGENAAVRIVKARKRKDEVAWVLHEIMKGIREDGLRFRDFAVVAGDLEGDREEIEEQFAAAGIPCFIDMRKPIAEDPLVRLLTDAMRVREAGFSFDSMFSFAKNPIVLHYLEENSGTEDLFSPFERISEAENFARARGFRFRAQYEKDWEASGRQFYTGRFPVINATKGLLFGGLFAFDDEMKAAGSVHERIEAIRALLRAYQAEEALDDLAKERITHPELADEYRRVHEKIARDLDRFEDIFGDRDLEDDLFRAVFESGLQSLVMGHVPPTKDRVVIGDLRRTRLSDVKRLFVIGANDGVLPKDHEGGGLLSDYDREILRAQQVELSETARELSAEDRYYIYLLLT